MEWYLLCLPQRLHASSSIFVNAALAVLRLRLQASIHAGTYTDLPVSNNGHERTRNSMSSRWDPSRAAGVLNRQCWVRVQSQAQRGAALAVQAGNGVAELKEFAQSTGPSVRANRCSNARIRTVPPT